VPGSPQSTSPAGVDPSTVAFGIAPRSWFQSGEAVLAQAVEEDLFGPPIQGTRGSRRRAVSEQPVRGTPARGIVRSLLGGLLLGAAESTAVGAYALSRARIRVTAEPAHRVVRPQAVLTSAWSSRRTAISV